jgi:uncharacterized membrane protein YidH (DUF202 family)
MAMNSMAGRRRGARSRTEASAAHGLNSIARVGFVARGIIYFLIGLLALAIATGKAAPQADRVGALQFIAGQTYGKPLLWALTVGLAAMALWRFAQVFFAVRRHSRRHGDEVQSFARGVIYAAFFVGTLHYAQGAGLPQNSGQQSRDFTAQAMTHSGGRVVVVVVGLVIAAIGLYMLWNGLTRRFLKDLRTGAMGRRTRTIVTWLGTVGNIARGLLFGALGAFMIDAGLSYKPSEAKGTDAVLRTFAHTAVGPVLLIAVAVGLALFGLFSLCEARWHRDL